MKLSNITERKFIESYPGNRRQILTPSGYKEIIEVHKTIPYRKFRIELNNNMSLECAYNHVIICSDNTEVYAKDSLNKDVITENGIAKVINVIDLEIEEHMYDISIDSKEEVYFSNGILSHNSGKSISTSIYASHEFVFSKERNIGIVGNKASLAREFLANIKNILLELPIWMTPGMNTWNKSSIEGENEMRILTDVPSQDSFRGFSIHLAIMDETAFIRANVWEEFIDAFLPSQSALAWKKNIILSTPKGMNHFYEMVKNASPHYGTDGSGIKEPGKSSNGYTLFKVDWKDVPRFDSKGNKMSNDAFMKQIIDKHGLQYFRQNFEVAFLGSSNTLISSEKLKDMESQPPEEIRDGMLNIYKYPEEKHRYIMTVDAAKDGNDAFSVDIVDITDFRFEQVASANVQIDYLLMPEFIDEWCTLYNKPYLIIENNEGAGQSIADQMYQTYEYENLHFDTKAESNSNNLTKSRKKYPGFRTTTKTRKQILQTLKLFIENNKLIIRDSKTISEFFTFILVKNKYQADDGCHDDSIMSLAMTFAPFCNCKNFEDMKMLVKNLYSENIQDSEKVTFGDMLVVGSFDDGYEFETEQAKEVIMTDNGYIIEDGGFI